MMGAAAIDPACAPEDLATGATIWVCAACGKTSRTRWGAGAALWDESCSMHAVLCHMPPRQVGDAPSWTAVEVQP